MTSRLILMRRHPRMFAKGRIRPMADLCLSGIQNRLRTWIPAFAGMTALLLTQTAFAANSKIGTSGAQFLKIGAGARSTAMGDAFVGIADDVNAVYYNPAGLGFLEKPEITAMRTQWFQGMNYDFGALIFPTTRGSLGLSISTLKADDLEKRDVDESYQGNFETLDAAYALSYGRKMGDNWSLGLTGRYLKQEIDHVSAGAWGGDLGIYKRMTSRPMTLGIAVKNLGTSIKFVDESDPQPMTIDAGAGTKFLSNKLLIGFNVQKPRDNDVFLGLGGEYKHTLRRDFRFALRGGYSGAKTEADGASGISIGAGLGYRLFDLDVAWVPYGDLGNTFRYAVVFRF